MVPDLPRIPYSLEIPQDAHNLLVTLAVEVGLVGTGAFLWMLAIAFVQAWRINQVADRQAKILSLGLAAGLGAMLVHTLMEITIGQGFITLVFFTYLGLLDAIARFTDE
jgi:O-antigen ligase